MRNALAARTASHTPSSTLMYCFGYSWWKTICGLVISSE
jgi:hypothetical protein